MVMSCTLSHISQNYAERYSCYRLDKKKKKKRLQQVSSNGLITFKLEENLMLKTYYSPGHQLFLLHLVSTNLSEPYDCCPPTFFFFSLSQLCIPLNSPSRSRYIKRKALRFESQNKNCRRQSHTRELKLQVREITTQLNNSTAVVTEKRLKRVKMK